MKDPETTRQLFKKVTYTRVHGYVGPDWAIRLLRRMDHRVNKARFVKHNWDGNSEAGVPMKKGGKTAAGTETIKDGAKKTIKRQVVDRGKVKA